jgi:hypothetical protein
MANLMFTEEDWAQVEEICAELDPETHELTADVLTRVGNPEDRATVLSFLRNGVRGELVVGIAARAMGSALIRNKVASAPAVRGWITEDFFERYQPLGLRDSNFSYNLGRAGDDYIAFIQIAKQVWGTIPQEFYALLDLANDRLFDSSQLYLDTMLMGDGS